MFAMSKQLVRAVVPETLRRRMWIALGRVKDPVPTYNHDGLITYGKSVEWMSDPRFASAYAKGMDSGHKIGRPKGSKADIHIEWRAHICCWAASHGAKLDGDFVECGVNTGVYSLTICHYLDFNARGKAFYLFDTYAGIPTSQMQPAEEAQVTRANERFYEDCYEVTRKNFAAFPRAVLVRGLVPDTLPTVPIERVAYLHLDMNIAYPEVKAIEFFWPKLVKGAMVVLDDYGWLEYTPQRRAMDAFANSRGVAIATLPTGQGVLIKPD